MLVKMSWIHGVPSVQLCNGAVLTFREYLNDYASAETRRIGEQLIEKELQEIEGMSFFTDKKLLPTFLNYYKRIASGERDLYM